MRFKISFAQQGHWVLLVFWHRLSSSLQVLATTTTQMAKHAHARKWSKHAVVLYRCAAAFWCAVEQMSVDDQRYASEAYLQAAQIAVGLAEEVYTLFTLTATAFHHSFNS
jgi:hypothetical protein